MLTNTASNPGRHAPANGEEIIRTLDANAIHMPIAQMMQELQVMVERLSFGMVSQKQELTAADISALLGSDVSKPMISFAHWMRDAGMLPLLSGKEARHFLAFCDRHYKDVAEIRCALPITPSDSFRKTLLDQLRTIHPEPARIIFDTVPSLVAGCVISDGHTQSDFSLFGRMPQLVGSYLAEKNAGATRG